MRLLLVVLALALACPLYADLSYIGSCGGNTSSCTPPAHQSGDLFVILAGRGGGATAPTLPSGWTSVGTQVTNTGGTNGSVRVACKVATSSSETVTGFTNADSLSLTIYRGQASGDTSTCASAILGTPSFYAGPTSSETTATFNGITNSASTSWVAGKAMCSGCTAGMTTAPTGMSNRHGSAGPPRSGSHDTNGGVASFTQANVTYTTAGRIITVTLEIKVAAAATGRVQHRVIQ